MANTDYWLPTKTSRQESPFHGYRHVMAGSDTLTIRSGKWYEVPNVYELVSCRLQLVCDATVANRYIGVQQLLGGGSTTDWIRTATAITASQSKVAMIDKTSTYVSGGMNPYCDQFCGCNGKYLMPISGDDDSIIITITGGVAGDAIDMRFQFRWLNWELGMDPPSAFTRFFNPAGKW